MEQIIKSTLLPLIKRPSSNRRTDFDIFDIVLWPWTLSESNNFEPYRHFDGESPGNVSHGRGREAV
jgi:hypothetical protein